MQKLAASLIGGIAGGIVVALITLGYLHSQTLARPEPAAASTSPDQLAVAKPAPTEVRVVEGPKKAHGASLKPSDCARLIDEDPALGPQLPKWQFPTVSEEVLHGIARGAGTIPLATRGDFDADGVDDVAFLILTRRPDSSGEPDMERVGVCLSSKAGAVVYIDDLYCSDGIDTTPKGAEYYDHEKDSTGHYAQDGIGTYCWEKAGATYLHENGSFTRVVDSD